jgi:LCP family protein required for cell wall assembly
VTAYNRYHLFSAAISESECFIMTLWRLIMRIVIISGCLAGIGGRATAQDATPSPDSIPQAMPLAEEGNDAIENILLLGADTRNAQNSGRTDVIVVLSLNFDAGTAVMLSIPRDLYVYVPEHDMQRINTAYSYGEAMAQGGGPALLMETVAYNLGLHIDHFARVDFNGFQTVIDTLGGIDVAVDCGIQDWRLREPELDGQVEENWEMFTLPIGMHRLDGELALWYARSRRTSSDFDRGRRHQVMLRAMLRRMRELGLLEQVRDVWPQALETVYTDIALDDILRMVPVALNLNANSVASVTFEPNVDVRSWRAPDGAAVQVPVRERVEALVARLLTPPTRLQIGSEHPRIEIINATGDADLALVAADRLAWEGFEVIVGEAAEAYQYETVLTDFTGASKGSSLDMIGEVLRVDPANMIITPDATRRADFRVVLGGEYYACTYNVAPPLEGVSGSG